MKSTKENPRVGKLQDNYKLPLYLGYDLNWVLKEQYSWIGEPEGWVLEPKFEKGTLNYDFWFNQTWDGIMEIILPKMQKDGLITEEINVGLLTIDKKIVFTEIMKIVNSVVPDVVVPKRNNIL